MLGYIISPAKTMNVLEGPPYVSALPRFLERTRKLMQAIQGLSYDEAKALWATSDKLTQLNFERFKEMNLERDLTAAVIAYEGIQYQHLAASIMDEESLAYLDAHLRILSGFYGVLRPADGVIPYRLEMQAKLSVQGARDLYEYWGASLAMSLAEEFDVICNLASQEYAKAVLPHAEKLNLPVLTYLFGEVKGEKFLQHSTEAKAARGSFVRWCAENKVSTPKELTSFDERGYRFCPDRSSEDVLVFCKSS